MPRSARPRSDVPPEPRAGQTGAVAVMCVCSARGRPLTSPTPTPLSGRWRSPGRARPQNGSRLLPRPQNPAGSAWRLVKVHERVSPLPTGGVSPSLRSSNLVRSRSPTSDELSQPSCGHPDRTWRIPPGAGPARPRAGRGVPLGWSGPTRGGAAGIRTPDLRRARAALSRLSYGPPRPAARHPRPAFRSGGVGAPGLEPGTSALSGPRSNHLSYAPAARSTPRRRRPGLPGPGIPSGGSSRVAPARPPARCPRRSARIRARTQPPVMPAWRRRPPRHPERPCQVLPPSRDGKTSGLGASPWRIITRQLDKVEGRAGVYRPRAFTP
jgi:hypothetical protein